ncbi:MAG: D-2-hydroxyacid dehydrogenase [Acidobacteria bacterium]|nr:D-2-hydroxyacid dehydrogenase [Acidobacteriota bacterium]
MNRPTPAETKLLICVWHWFTLWQPPAEFSDRIRNAYPDMHVVHLPNYDRLSEEIVDADIFVGWRMRREQFVAAKKLKWIHATAAGVAPLMFPELRTSGVVMTNASGIHAIPMAEHIVGMLIALARQFPTAMRFQMQGKWGQQESWEAPVRPSELAGKTLLFVGFGAIGREVARLLKPFGMRIWAVTRSGKGDAALAEKYFPSQQLDGVLHEADYVILAAPETPATEKMFGAKQFAAMKPSAFFLNVSRGTLVDEAAMIATLEKRAIAGAALDVTEHEPLPAESPLWKLENVFITPHTSGVSDALWPRQGDLLLDNLERWFAGMELRNRVDLDRGY